jgi:hypothetical protein
MTTHYQIRFKGHLDPSWSAWFDDLTFTYDATGETILTGSLPDQAALYGVLEKARNLNLTLIAVGEIPATLPADDQAVATSARLVLANDQRT